MTDAPLWMALGAALNGAFLAWLWKPWRQRVTFGRTTNLLDMPAVLDDDTDCQVGCFVCGWRADVPQGFVSAAVQVHADTCPGLEHDE